MDGALDGRRYTEGAALTDGDNEGGSLKRAGEKMIWFWLGTGALLDDLEFLEALFDLEPFPPGTCAEDGAVSRRARATAVALLSFIVVIGIQIKNAAV